MTLQIKAIIALAAALGLVLGYLYWHHVVYQDGYTTAEAKYTTLINAANAETAALRDEMKATRDSMKALLDAKQKEYAANLAAAEQQTKTVTQTVTKVIHDNPDFAAVRRPSALDGVRHDQLEALRSAADRQSGKGTAPVGGSLNSLSGTSHRDLWDSVGRQRD